MASVAEIAYISFWVWMDRFGQFLGCFQPHEQMGSHSAEVAIRVKPGFFQSVMKRVTHCHMLPLQAQLTEVISTETEIN